MLSKFKHKTAFMSILNDGKEMRGSPSSKGIFEFKSKGNDILKIFVIRANNVYNMAKARLIPSSAIVIGDS